MRFHSGPHFLFAHVRMFFFPIFALSNRLPRDGLNQEQSTENYKKWDLNAAL